MTASSYDYGDVLLASYPFTDQSTTKLRPVLVVSKAEFNRGGDLVVLPISSQIKPNDKFGSPIRETDAHFGQSGLKLASTVKWTKPMTITDAVIQRRLGSLPATVVDRITKQLATVIGQ